MDISVDGQSCVPPGFRFHPTEEELLSYYLRKKVAGEEIDLDVIRDVDLNKLEPWDIQEKCRIGSAPQNDWYFFSHKDKKYPTGTRTNRATAAGFWKATGRDKTIYSGSRPIGMRKTLVFYKGRAPHGQKSDWIMHEYRLDDHSVDLIPQSNFASSTAEAANQEDGWVVCRLFKKKSFHRAVNSPNSCSSFMHDNKSQLLHSASDDGLDQILQYLGRSCKQEGRAIDANYTPSAAHVVQERFLRLPSLESPTYSQLPPCGYHSSYVPEPIHAVVSNQSDPAAGVGDWAAFDRLFASQLDVQRTDQTEQQDECSFDDHVFTFWSSDEHKPGGDDGDLWSLTRSALSASADRMGQVSI